MGNLREISLIYAIEIAKLTGSASTPEIFANAEKIHEFLVKK